MGVERSLTRRVALAAALAASVAALLAAVSTSVLAMLLLQRAEDRRLREAALVLAAELTEAPTRVADMEMVVRDESEEMGHTGIRFAVIDPRDQVLAGERHLRPPAHADCDAAEDASIRVCRAASSHGLTVLAASAGTLSMTSFALSALVATVLGGMLAWIASRPISRMTVAPLSRLRARLAVLDVDAREPLDLGPHEHVVEVDQLRDTVRQLLQRVTRSVDQAQRFAANAAHELRTPLTSVRAELELLAEDATMSADAIHNITRVGTKVAELGALVERLLILATPKHARGDANEMVSLRDVFDDAIAALAPHDRQRVQTTEADVSVRGDAVLLATMVANALANALKFGNRVSVTLGLAGNEGVVHIDDDGPGVNAADRERAFEPFFRSEGALAHRIPGHGLGLALIRHIAETHGGSAAFVDTTNRGARLEIRLPAIRRAEAS